MQINPQTITQTLILFVGNLPTFIAVILAWMHSNGRFSDAQARTSDISRTLDAKIEASHRSLEGKINDKFDTLRAEIRQLDQKVDHTRELLKAEFLRVEEILDARVKHLEERER